jgi:hypothetical protein
VDLTFTYDRAATGVLSATTPWGALNLPARLAGTIASGEFGINASGEATLIMPDQTALDACLTTNAKSADLAHKDCLLSLSPRVRIRLPGAKRRFR